MNKESEKVKIVYKKIEDLIPYLNNTRTHTEEQVNQVASSIKEFGFTNPALIDKDGGIIAGHCRTLAAKKLKLKEIPCIELNNLTEAQKKAYIIADNKLALNAGWNEELLKIEIESLKELDFDLDLLGFDDFDLGKLLDEGNEDIEDVENISMYYNFIVKCEGKEELEALKNKLNVDKDKITFKELSI